MVPGWWFGFYPKELFCLEKATIVHTFFLHQSPHKISQTERQLGSYHSRVLLIKLAVPQEPEMGGGYTH